MPIKKVYLELTNKCNLKCSMCYRKSWAYETSNMKPEALEVAIKQLKDIETLEEIVLGGIGEPTFCNHAEQTMRELKDYYLTLTTNGTLLEGKMLEAVVDTIDHVIISIDGMKDTFYAIRGFPLEGIIKNISNINQMKSEKGLRTPLISFQMVISNTNKDEILELIDLASSLDGYQVILSNVLPTTLDDQTLPLYTRYENPEMKELFQKIRIHSFRRGIEVKLPAYQLKTERRCRFVEDNTTMITANGDVVPCYRFAHSGGEVVFGRAKTIQQHTFGNILKKSIKEIWDRPEYITYRSTVLNNRYPSCIDCDLVDGCDMVRDAEGDCYGNYPSCADCLWSRNLIYCV